MKAGGRDGEQQPPETEALGQAEAEMKQLVRK
jgi:hypothetical protein